VLVANGDEEHGKPARRHQTQHDSEQQERALGEVVVGTGRISTARQVRSVLPTLPFTKSQRAALDDALVCASRSAGLHFGVYLGDLGPDTRARAEELHELMGGRADDAVLIAVSPGQRVVEVVSGCRAHHRLPDRGCKLAVESMISSFKEGDLTGGLTSGLRILTEQTDS
jgi:tartrate dehydratase beta subunit/fumarate hydratase class I family protein